MAINLNSAGKKVPEARESLSIATFSTVELSQSGGGLWRQKSEKLRSGGVEGPENAPLRVNS